eukprot:4753132-Amphidinium_carterae.1
MSIMVEEPLPYLHVLSISWSSWDPLALTVSQFLCRTGRAKVNQQVANHTNGSTCLAQWGFGERSLKSPSLASIPFLWSSASDASAQGAGMVASPVSSIQSHSDGACWRIEEFLAAPIPEINS